MTKKTSRTQSKSQREMVDHLRLKAMASFVENMDSRLSAIADDISLLVSLQVAKEEDRNKIIEMIRKGAEDAKLQRSDENTAENSEQLELPITD